jgi:hypothetical protein
VIEYSEVDVTPDMAAQWLANATVNRSVRQRKVMEFASDMESNNWAMTGETIKFDRDGRLIDGQHRLHAVIRSGTTVRMGVANNVDFAAQRVMDSGAARTAADTLRIDGYDDAVTVASVARLVIGWKRGYAQTSHNDGITKSEIYDFVNSNPDIKDAARIAVTATQDRGALPLQPSIVGLAAYVIAQTNGYDMAEQFFRAAAEKVGLEPGDPVLAMCKCFHNAAIKRRTIPLRSKLAIVIRCFNARVSGMSVDVIKMSANGAPLTVPKVLRVNADDDDDDDQDDVND